MARYSGALNSGMSGMAASKSLGTASTRHSGRMPPLRTYPSIAAFWGCGPRNSGILQSASKAKSQKLSLKTRTTFFLRRLGTRSWRSAFLTMSQSQTAWKMLRARAVRGVKAPPSYAELSSLFGPRTVRRVAWHAHGRALSPQGKDYIPRCTCRKTGPAVGHQIVH